VEPLIPRDEPALPSSLDPARFQAHVASLRNPSAEIAVRAALSLRAFGPPAADPLREVLANLDGFCHPTVRAAAVQALGGLVPLKEGALFAEAAADPDVEVSLAAINALVARKDPLAVEVLLTVVENPSGFYVQATRLAAARGLRQLGVTGTSILGELCNTEANAEIREALAPLAS
jgi:HEAT repeat protein